MRLLRDMQYYGLLALMGIIVSLVQANSPDLVQLQNIEASMDHSRDPCEDFSGYACGNWAKVHGHAPYADIPEFLLYNHSLRMSNFLRSEYPRELWDQKPIQTFIDKAVVYLHSCLELQHLDVWRYLDVIKPATDLEWPLLDGINVPESAERPWSKFDAFTLLGQLHSYGYNTDVIKQKTLRVKGKILTVMTIPDVSNFDTDAVRSVLADLKLPDAVAARHLEEIRKTHAYWQAAYKDYAEFGESENLFTYDDIKQSNPQLNTFVEMIIPRHLREAESIVAMPYWDYIQFLLSRQWQPYENQKFCNYLMVKFLIYLKQVNADGCLIAGQQKMHLAFDYLYYKHFYLSQGREINADLTALTKKIHKQFLATIYENHLEMSHNQVKMIKDKLSNMTINIGNLPVNVSRNMVEEFYRHLPNMTANNFYANDLLLLQHRILESVTCPPAMSCQADLQSIPFNNDNLIIVPFAALRLPLYDLNMDALLTISNFGWTLAHVLTQAADSESLTLSKNFDILEEFMEEIKAKEAIKCLQASGSNDSIDVHIADLMGALVTYRTYRRDYNLQPNFTRIPWKQLFFFNLGQFFCGKMEDDLAEEENSNGRRLNRIAMNSKEFAEAFQCPEGSKMNPARKCRFY